MIFSEHRSDHNAGGGGGRIALFYKNPISGSIRFSAAGGLGFNGTCLCSKFNPTLAGGNGTVYITNGTTITWTRCNVTFPVFVATTGTVTISEGVSTANIVSGGPSESDGGGSENFSQIF